MGGIFISYRREDTKPYAGRLSDALRRRFGRAHVFRDIDTIRPGADFPVIIDEAVGSCDVLIALIGRRWLTAKDDRRHHRIDNPADYVRLELASALRRDVLVIPVLVENASMPDADELPADLAELVRKNALRLTDEGWDDQLQHLVRELEGVIRPPAPSARPTGDEWGPPAHTATRTERLPAGARPGPAPRRRAVAGAVAITVALLAVLLIVLRQSGNHQSTTPGATVVATSPSVVPTSVALTFPQPRAAEETDIRLSPTSGPPGTTVTVSGTGFDAGETIDIRFHTNSVQQTHADAQGAFSGASFKVPSEFAPFRGVQFQVVATGRRSIASAQAPFQLT